MFYTFRVLNSFTGLYECAKFEDGRPQPLELYYINWRKGTLSAHMCDCPVRVPCKHLNMLQEILASNKKLWEVIYEDGIVDVVDQTVCVYRELIE